MFMIELPNCFRVSSQFLFFFRFFAQYHLHFPRFAVCIYRIAIYSQCFLSSAFLFSVFFLSILLCCQHCLYHLIQALFCLIWFSSHFCFVTCVLHFAGLLFIITFFRNVHIACKFFFTVFYFSFWTSEKQLVYTNCVYRCFFSR